MANIRRHVAKTATPEIVSLPLVGHHMLRYLRSTAKVTSSVKLNRNHKGVQPSLRIYSSCHNIDDRTMTHSTRKWSKNQTSGSFCLSIKTIPSSMVLHPTFDNRCPRHSIRTVSKHATNGTEKLREAWDSVAQNGGWNKRDRERWRHYFPIIREGFDLWIRNKVLEPAGEVVAGTSCTLNRELRTQEQHQRC